jgi:hypothetical protein
MRARTGSVVAASVYLVAALTAAQAQGTCSKPEIPSCAIERGRFTGEEDYDKCRFQMLKHKSGMESYAECLDGASRPTDGQSARDELEQGLAQFNRKARGELD